MKRRARSPSAAGPRRRRTGWRRAARAPPRRARPPARPGPASPGAGGVASVGAGIPGGGALSLGAGIGGGGRRRPARATRNRRAPTGRHRTMRVMGRLRFWVEARAIIHTTAELPASTDSRLKWTGAATDVVLCGNSSRIRGKAFWKSRFVPRGQGDVVSSPANRMPRTPGSLRPGRPLRPLSAPRAHRQRGDGRGVSRGRAGRAGVRARVRRQAHPARQVRFTEVRADVLRGGAHLGAAAITRTSYRSTTSVTSTARTSW